MQDRHIVGYYHDHFKELSNTVDHLLIKMGILGKMRIAAVIILNNDDGEYWVRAALLPIQSRDEIFINEKYDEFPSETFKAQLLMVAG